MPISRIAVYFVVSAVLCGCGGNDTCTEPEPYQASVEGRRIEVPEGLNALEEGRELKVPDASPAPPRPEGSPCLELPPSYSRSD
ncbi:MAG: hypothetical protein L0Y45_05860 [Woeseiaceae bacterium]|nr:hypothetical protein [Woeseiaceae bacterium]